MTDGRNDDSISTDELETQAMNPFTGEEKDLQEDIPTTVLPPVTGDIGHYRIEGSGVPETETLTALKEADPKVSASQLILELEKLDEVPEEEKKNGKLIAAGVAAGALVFIVGGFALVNGLSDDDDSEPVASEVTKSETAKPKKADDDGKGIADWFKQPTEKPTEESKKPDKKEERETPEVEEQKPDIPKEDDVKKIAKTPDGTEIHNFKDANLVPYEKFNKNSKAQSPSETTTGNNYNDEYQKYRTNLGVRHKGSLSPEQYSERIVRDAMKEAVDKSGIDIDVPDKPDYKTARLMSSGYTLWNISDGYVLVMGNDSAKAIISPDKKDDKLTDAAIESSETLIPQRYADRYAVSFDTLDKTVGGAQNPDDNSKEWQ